MCIEGRGPLGGSVVDLSLFILFIVEFRILPKSFRDSPSWLVFFIGEILGSSFWVRIGESWFLFLMGESGSESGDEGEEGLPLFLDVTDGECSISSSVHVALLLGGGVYMVTSFLGWIDLVFWSFGVRVI